jgi:hypothetical protein
MEEASQPGTARFGNFINYYSFNPPEKRLDLMQQEISLFLKENSNRVVHCLDIGCNSGVGS